jgi:anti-sigma factor RsiW
MTHPTDLLSAHLDGELLPSQDAMVVEHVAQCRECAAELEDASTARTLLRSLPMLDAPIPLLPAVRRAPRWIAAAASVAAVALAVGLALAPGQQTSVFDLGRLAGQHTTRVGVEPGISTLRSPLGAP